MVKYAGGALLPSLAVDREASAPLTAQLASSLRELILSGDLAPGQRLPSSRTLAQDQGVSRTTAVGVYDRLASEGLIVSRVGAGAFVSEALRESRPAPAPRAESPRAAPRLARLGEEASGLYFPRLAHPESPRPFVTGTPAFDAFPMALWARLSARVWRRPRAQLLGHPEPGGLHALRRAISAHLRANRGVDCAPGQVFVFNGAQDAFNRIGATLLDPGDTAWIENPGPIGARNSLLACGARLAPLPVDDEGIDVAEGLRTAPDFRLAFVTPAHQHPLGVPMSLRRRFELLRAAERAGAWIVEDDYVGEFHYTGRPPPTLRSVDAEGRVIYVGTFSKTLFPGLRLGYAVAPPGLVDAFARIAGATLQGAPASLQAMVAEFIEEGHFAAHLRRMRRLYAERRQALLDAAGTHLAGLAEIAPSETGLHAIARLAPGFDETRVAAAAEARGVAAAPVSRFAIGETAQKGLVLGFSAAPPKALAAAAATLGEVMRGMR
jgi:GntR family transcriptional regulator / MocR family aminotransferase